MKAKIRRAVMVPLQNSPATFFSFDKLADEKEHFAVGFGGWKNQANPLVRIHSECITGDVFQSSRCDCGDQLREAIELLINAGGILLYLRQEGRGIGFYNKLDAYALQQQGLDTFEANLTLNFPADLRNYFVAVQMLKTLNISHVRLLTNNPDKVRQLVQYGIEVTEVVPTGTYVKAHNFHYLKAKTLRAFHHLVLPGKEVHDAAA